MDKDKVELGKDEYLAVIWSTPNKGFGYTYSTHRSLTAARRQAKKMNGRVYVCSNGVQRYEII